jgi:hypothetical protein
MTKIAVWTFYCALGIAGVSVARADSLAWPIIAPDGTIGPIVQIPTSELDPAAAPFNWMIWPFPNGFGDARKDIVMRLGYNIDIGGGVYQPGEPALADEWESHYAPSAGAVQFERHIAYTDVNGVQHRPMSWAIRQDTLRNECSFQADKINFFDSSNSNQAIVFKADSTSASLLLSGSGSPTYLLQAINGVPALMQINAAGSSFRALIGLSSDCFRLGDSAEKLPFIVGGSGFGLWDTGASFQLSNSGQLQWTGGPNGTSYATPDAGLGRAAAGVVKVTDGSGGVGALMSSAITLSGDDADVKILAGLGSPEGKVTANAGSLYLRKDGGRGKTLYVKEWGSGALGWSAK